MCPVSSKVVVLGNQQGLDLGSVKSMAQGSQVRDSPIFLVDLGWWCKSARCFKHCCQAATVDTFCCCTRSICMLAAGVDSRPWATGQCWYDMLNMYIDTAPQMLAMLASRCWLYIFYMGLCSLNVATNVETINMLKLKQHYVDYSCMSVGSSSVQMPMAWLSLYACCSRRCWTKKHLLNYAHFKLSCVERHVAQSSVVLVLLHRDVVWASSLLWSLLIILLRSLPCCLSCRLAHDTCSLHRSAVDCSISHVAGVEDPLNLSGVFTPKYWNCCPP